VSQSIHQTDFELSFQILKKLFYITEQQRIIYGFQRNNYTKTVSTTAQETRHYDYIYVGYAHDIYESKQGIWKPYLGVNGILSDETVSAALIIGSRWSIGKTCQLESRITASKKNLNAQLGISMRYRKSKSSKVN
jgi:hypothetical protein